MSSATSSGWPAVALESLLTDIQPGFASGKHNSSGEGVAHFRPMNVSVSGRIDRRVLKYVDPAAGRPEQRLQRGDVVFNNTNSPELVGKTALFDDDDSPAFSNHMTRLRTDSSRLDPSFLALRLHQAWREGWFAAHCNNHVSQSSVGRDVLRGFEIELPPLEIQHAIVALSRAIGAKRDVAAGHLASACLALDHFRQALLVAACTGRLTSDWRSQNPDAVSVEHALAEKQTKPKRASREQPVDLEMPELPENYVVATVGDAAVRIEYGTSRRVDGPPGEGVPVLGMANIQDGRVRVDVASLKTIRADDEIAGLLLEDGDLLFNRTNSPELVGKSAVYRGEGAISFASYLIRVRFDPAVAEPDFVNYWLNSAWGRIWARLAKTDGVSQSNINGSKLALMAVPLPPIEEQRLIVERVGAMFASAERLLGQVRVARQKLELASQAVLVKAFRGELAGLIAEGA